MVHPSLTHPNDAAGVTVPVCLLPSQGEDKQIMGDFWAIIEKKPFAGKCVRKDFDDVHHGFAAGRSDWSDPKLGARARDAFQILADFFKANL
ncbi:hypothetical protein MMC08_006314 [Hypocenomyce scalaris]|nr:hypothetical protein [Hypocenomyce scalaris]